MAKPYDASWDQDADPEAFDKKYQEWLERDWPLWLQQHLLFPFEVERVEDNDEAYFTNVAEQQPFRLGHTFNVVAIEMEDDFYGVTVKAREGRKVGHVPLCDLEVTSQANDNYWPVREYVVWFANR